MPVRERDLDDPDPADQQVERQRLGPWPAVEKCRGASTWVPACALMWSVDTFELSPRASRLMGSRLNGVLCG